jgi:hypothetical protein
MLASIHTRFGFQQRSLRVPNRFVYCRFAADRSRMLRFRSVPTTSSANEAGV